MSPRAKPNPKLREDLAQTEGEPQDEHAAIPDGEMPAEHGRVRVQTDHWHQKLVQREVKGGIATEPIGANVTTILRHHPEWSGVVAYDEFRETIVTLRPPPWHAEDAPAVCKPGPWTDGDDARLTAWLARSQWQLNMPASAIDQGLATAAEQCAVHPVRDYLDGLVWDGVERIDVFLHSYMHTSNTLWEQKIGAMWLRSCVARIYQPGCQVDHALVLEGEQGLRKSTAFEALVPERFWYADSGIDVTNKDSYDALRGVWIYCIGELASLAKGDVERWKNFLTSKHDHYRPSYGKRARDFLRQTVFCADTNKDRYLTDATGNRRFWPVKVLSRIDVDAIRRDRDQLWAEAVHTYKAKQPWHLDTDGGDLLAREQQAARMTEEPWETIVADWLASPTHTVFDGGTPHPEPLDLGRGLLVAEVLQHALKIKPEHMKGEPVNRVAAILARLGWTNRRSKVGGARAMRWYAPADDGS